jgi:hypothetical protein
LVSQSIISQWYKKFFGSAMLSYQSWGIEKMFKA